MPSIVGAASALLHPRPYCGAFFTDNICTNTMSYFKTPPAYTMRKSITPGRPRCTALPVRLTTTIPAECYEGMLRAVQRGEFTTVAEAHRAAVIAGSKSLGF